MNMCSSTLRSATKTMTSFTFTLHSWWWRKTLTLILFASLLFQSLSLNQDGRHLLSFKSSILNDPLFVFETWNPKDKTPCSWYGVTCSNDSLRVITLSLSNSHLQGSVSAKLGLLENLKKLDLSNNSLSGSIPFSIFSLKNLFFLDISSNMISGQLPELIGQLQKLQKLDLSNNTFTGSIPFSIFSLKNLSFIDLSSNSISGHLPENVGQSEKLAVLNLSENGLSGKLPIDLGLISSLKFVSLKKNYFYGDLPTGFKSAEFLDLSLNLLNGSLPSDFGGFSIRFMNLSYNRISGQIPFEFGKKFVENAKIDLSFNNFTGRIPRSTRNREPGLFWGTDMVISPVSSAIPESADPNPVKRPTRSQQTVLKSPVVIIGIAIGDIAGISILATFFIFLCKLKKNMKLKSNGRGSSTSLDPTLFFKWSCLGKKESNSFPEEVNDLKSQEDERQEEKDHGGDKKGTLVTVDGNKELEVETLLKASAYILGATGSSIMYKAVLEDGTELAVRRISEGSLGRLREFETQVRVIAKLVHPNLVKIRGFYWGVDEKLIIYDFVPNSSLANARFKKMGSSPCHLPWEFRLKIARGVARGLTYLHEKKHVHGNLKPSNILLDSDMEPKIGDFGLERLLTGESFTKLGGSSRIFGSKRSFQDVPTGSVAGAGAGPSPSPSPSYLSPYLAPESFRHLKPNPKWDVYSFGVILLELLTTKIIVVDESGQGNGLVVEDTNRALRMADVAIRGELEGKEESLLTCFKLGYNCASPIPQKRPSIKEVLQVLEKFPGSSSSSLQSYGY